MKRWTVLAALLVAGGLVQAAEATAAKKDLVKKVLQVQQPGIEGLGNAVAGQTSQQILLAASRQAGRVPADQREQVGKAIQEDVRKFYDDVAPALRATAVKQAPGTLGAALEDKLSEDELKALIAWLESPVSRKYQQLSSEAQPALTQKIISESRSTVEPKLKALDQSISKKLGLPPAEDAAKKK
jgi:gas vesicle protein